MIQEVFPCFDTSFNGGLLEAQSMKSLHLSLLVLKEKISQVESFLNIFVTQEISNSYHAQPLVDELTSSMAYSSMANLVQEIVQTASVMMLSCEQMAFRSTVQATNENNGLAPYSVEVGDKGNDQEFPILEGNSLYNWSIPVDTTYNNNSNNRATEDIAFGGTTNATTSSTTTTTTTAVEGTRYEDGHEVVELNAADLLARYTHYCQVCGRGFKREANLRMHMKAHGDKYKSNTLMVSNNNTLNKKLSIYNGDEKSAPKRYSCPQEGCRWNKNHVKFQPLKSIVCVKNHYKRSHCPKMFVCKRCNTKEYSVLSDLKTHEKHCGEIKWYCSCGTSFSKKDKLMDHVALFVGHIPLITSNSSYQIG